MNAPDKGGSVTHSSTSPIQRRLSLLSAHLVVALIALVVIGGATRVMEAGLACPDWPLCYGTFLPGRQMNLQVFLEWFHRLDAFVVGLALMVMAVTSIVWRHLLPRWLPWLSCALVVMVALQGLLGALTVLHLLESSVVTAHMLLALTLVAALSGLTQRLRQGQSGVAPLWWRSGAAIALIGVTGQCLVGARMATSWAAQRCLASGEGCQWLVLHRATATPVALTVLLFAAISLAVVGWTRQQWPFLFGLIFLVTAQVGLGVLTLRLGLNQPAVTIAHQLLAALLVALLAALLVRRPDNPSSSSQVVADDVSLEPCHG